MDFFGDTGGRVSPSSFRDDVELGTGSLHLDLARRVCAEALGTFFLLLAVVGSGIMAQTLSPHDVGLQLLENAAATAGALVGVILMFGVVSGAHFNPVVSAVDAVLGTTTWRDVAWYVPAQIAGACSGVMVANVLYSHPIVTLSHHTRSSWALWLSEVAATVGLLLVINGCVRSGRSNVVPFAVGAWIAGAYFFTSSTSFANPAAAIGRCLTNSFAGIAPSSVAGFVISEIVGAVIAVPLIVLFYPSVTPEVGRE